MRATRRIRGGSGRTGSSARLREVAGVGLIEAITAMAILSIGVLAVTGITLQVGAQNRVSTWQTDESLVAGQVFERLRRAGYAAAAGGNDTVAVGNRTYVVGVAVTTPATRVKQVDLSVRPRRGGTARTYTGRIYETRPLPSAP